MPTPTGILVNQIDLAKLFIFGNNYRSATYTNSTGSEVNLTAGMLMGRIYSSGKVKQSVSTAQDGSQLPIGVLANDYTVANNETVTVNICIKGEVTREMITFAGADSFSTLLYYGDDTNSPPGDTNFIGVGSVEDWLWGRGILTVAGTNNTYAEV